MDKKQYIEYWLNSAQKDIATMTYLVKGRKYVHALFFGHLYLEKIAKAGWIKSNKENFPPKIHNLLTIINQAGIILDESQQLFLLKLNQYQIEGRYPEDVEKLYKITSKELTSEYILSIKAIAKCLLKELR